MPRADTNIRNQTINAKIPKVVRLAVLQRDEGRCINCGATESLELDAIAPLAEGGAMVESNLRLLCASCMVIKGRW
ncbi:HNH endonuclease [Deinococcus alpinitundrae]|uniref:HNH endonuclease n=1 Tax=Deinococcus alpinitundrae TaxID=468913 RepID=UPI00137A94BE|nr:HNH endonuclease [Deinococcus alpinitundrae]